MTRKKLNKIWRAIDAARRTLPKLVDLEKLARMCGREPCPGGSHQMWLSPFRAHRAFPIPRHGGNPDASYAVRDTVLDHLETDAAAWEEVVERTGEQEIQDDETEFENGDENGTG